MTRPLDELFRDSLARDEHHVAHHPLLMLRKDSLADVMHFAEQGSPPGTIPGRQRPVRPFRSNALNHQPGYEIFKA